MSLSEKLTADLKTAMRAKDKQTLNLLRSVKSSFKNLEIETQQPLTTEEETAVLMKMIKQRKEAADGFRKGGAEERAANEDWEAKALQSYLPPAPTDEEIESAIDAELANIPESERSPKTMGILMKALNERFAGRPVDGKALSQKVRAKL